MSRPKISTTLITLNEEQSIRRALDSVRWCDEIIVVDSGSTDRTVEIAKEYGAKVFHNAWPGYGKQKNFAHSKAAHDWILNIDADEEVPGDLAATIEAALEENERKGRPIKGYYFPRKTFYLGRWIQHGGWYPNHLVRLAEKSYAKWTEPTVHEALQVEGEILDLKKDLFHYTFSSIEDQVQTNLRYSRLGFRALQSKGARPSLLKLLVKPIWKFFDTFFLKKGFLDGLPGFIISVNAAHSMFLKYAYLFEVKLHDENSNHRQLH